jgi:hypothetical protein
MTQNTLELWPEILAVAGGALVLFLFAVTIAIHHRASVPSGSQGHRDKGAPEHEEIRPDGYIDSFAGEIEEAGGGLPPVLKLALPAVIIWWLLYLLLFWAPR